MGRTPDRFPGSRDEEEVVFETNTGGPSSPGGVTYNGTVFQMEDAAGVFDPRTGGGGISEGQHRILDQLVHAIVEDDFVEYTYGVGNRVVAITTWTSAAKVVKIREELFAYTGRRVTQIVTKQYDGAGVLVPTTGTFAETVTYAGRRVASIAGVIS